MHEVDKSRPNGIWQITSATPEKNNHRVNRYVVFPWELQKGGLAMWLYVNWDGQEERGGQICRTSIIETIEKDYHNVQITTRNSQYKFRLIQ